MLSHRLFYQLICIFLLTIGCGPSISETRMVAAPAREPDCALELVHVDTTSMNFNQQWDVLGYVAISDTGAQDPTSTANREIVRPRACGMGGTVVAVALNATNTTAMGQGSALLYMVLRPKSSAPPPSKF